MTPLRRTLESLRRVKALWTVLYDLPPWRDFGCSLRVGGLLASKPKQKRTADPGKSAGERRVSRWPASTIVEPKTGLTGGPRSKTLTGNGTPVATSQPTKEAAKRWAIAKQADIENSKVGIRPRAVQKPALTVRQLIERSIAEYHGPKVRKLKQN